MQSKLNQIKLTTKQEECFKRLREAYRDCNESGVFLQQLDDRLIGLNSNAIDHVIEGKASSDNEIDLYDCDMDVIEMEFEPWVDCDVVVKLRQQ